MSKNFFIISILIVLLIGFIAAEVFTKYNQKDSCWYNPEECVSTVVFDGTEVAINDKIYRLVLSKPTEWRLVDGILCLFNEDKPTGFAIWMNKNSDNFLYAGVDPEGRKRANSNLSEFKMIYEEEYKDRQEFETPPPITPNFEEDDKEGDYVKK